MTSATPGATAAPVTPFSMGREFRDAVGYQMVKMNVPLKYLSELMAAMCAIEAKMQEEDELAARREAVTVVPHRSGSTLPVSSIFPPYSSAPCPPIPPPPMPEKKRKSGGKRKRVVHVKAGES